MSATGFIFFLEHLRFKLAQRQFSLFFFFIINFDKVPYLEEYKAFHEKHFFLHTFKTNFGESQTSHAGEIYLS